MNGYLEEITIADFAPGLALVWTGFPWLILMYKCNNEVSAASIGGKTTNLYWLRGKWFIVMASEGQSFLIWLLFLTSRCLM